MKAEELRIGNVVLYKDDSTLFKIDEVTATGLTATQLGGGETTWIEYDEFEPVKLTPEWLKKFGFVKDKNGWELPGTKFSLTDKFYPCWFDRMLWPQDLPEFNSHSLQYVHTLQNLYFALTNQELTSQK